MTGGDRAPCSGPDAGPVAARIFLNRIQRSGIAGATREGLESAAPAPLPDRGQIADRICAEVDYIARLTRSRPDPDALAELIAAGQDGLDRLNADGAEARLAPVHLAGLEAVIRSDGTRPVLFVRDGMADLTQPSIAGSPLAVELGEIESSIRRIAAATGRVDDPSAQLGYQGTAFVVGDGVVMTNRHVLGAISREQDPDHGTLKDGITINFGHELGVTTAPLVCAVTDILFRGRAGGQAFDSPEIGLNFDELDIALLAIDGAAPEPLAIPRGTGVAFATKGRRSFLLGYPGNTAGLTADIFDRLFGGVKGFKRLAPGEIVEQAGDPAIQLDPDKWTLTHDASTLGGNSGSPICDREGNKTPLLGIHFAGMADRRNWGHCFEALGTPLVAVAEKLNFVP